jgi:tetratricopeptide (TPR) repeat protein
VAAVLDARLEQVEETCERLARSQRFLRPGGTEAWPDGAVAARYAFAHALYQRVLYRRLPAGRRRAIHQKLGDRLETGFGARAPEIAVELAGHFERGAESGRAVGWLTTAAASADHRFAPREAATHLRRALELLEKTPDGPERGRSELQLTMALAAAVIATNGLGAEGALDTLTRAETLATDVGTPIERFRVAYMLMNATASRGDAVRRATRTVEFPRLAALVGTREARLVANMVAASYRVWDGRNADGGGLAEMAAADPAALDTVVPGESLVVWANGQEGWRLWATGRPNAARTYARAAVACARLRPNPADLAVALFLAAHVPLWRGDLDDATAMVDEGRRLAGEHGFGLWLAGLRGVAGAIHVARGEAAAAVSDLEPALAEFRRLGVLMHTPTMLAGLGTACLQLGRLPEGVAAVDEGIELGRSTRSCWYEPELWTLRGRLLAAQGASSDAVKSAFEQALEVARSHGALSFELRAAIARAEWLASRGRGGDARATLAACHARFREGADTADLRQASKLLARLGA